MGQMPMAGQLPCTEIVWVRLPLCPLIFKNQYDGVKFVVEVLKPRKRSKTWGDYNPATGKVEGSFGNQIGIDEKDSQITEENGFKNIVILPVGVSPMAYIEMRQKQLKSKQ